MLLMLSHPDFSNALQPLKEHKDYTDLPSYVMDWQQVSKAYGKWGRDDPEKLKQSPGKPWPLVYYICHAGRRFKSLSMRYTDRPESNDEDPDWAFYSADLYYADLYEADNSSFEDWDLNDDGYYGELHGEQIIGVVNVDAVDTNPDIAVGRIPAENSTEVTTYVNKVINAYEFNSYQTDWAKKALMIATTDFVGDACLAKNTIADTYLLSEGYSSTKFYQSGNPCQTTDPPSSANINATMNSGEWFCQLLWAWQPDLMGHSGRCLHAQ